MKNTRYLMIIAACSLVTGAYAAKAVSDCTIGARTERNGNNQSSVNAFNNAAGKDIKVYMFYPHFGNPWPTTHINLARNNNAILHMKFVPTNGDHPENVIYDKIKNGLYDDDFTTIGNNLANFSKTTGKNVWFDFAHEMNGVEKSFQVTDWGTANGPDRFIAAWKRIHGILKDRMEANNVSKSRLKMVFAPVKHIFSVPEYKYLENIYPGNSYVDLIGCSVYNKLDNWKNLLGTKLNTLSAEYTALTNDQRYFILSETACARDPDNASRRPNWITANYTESIFRSYDIKHFNWYDSDAGGHQHKLTDTASQDALRDALSVSFFKGR